MNAYPPMISPRFQVSESGVLQYKPYPAYPSWLDAWDVGALVPADVQTQIDDINAAIEALEATDTDQYGLLDGIATDIIDLQNRATAVEGAASLAQTDATQALSDAAAAQATADAALAAAGGAKDRRVTMFHDEANVSGGTLSVSINSIYQNNYVAFSTAQGFNAVQSFACDLMPACKLKFIGTTANNQGIMAVYVDENFIGSIDWYSSTTVNNVTKALSFAASALTAGRHTLRLEMTTKNGSSSGYALTLTKYWLAPDNDFA